MPTTYLSPQFGAYVYTPATDEFHGVTDGLGAKLRSADPPSVDGAFTAGGLIAARDLSVRGTLTVPTVGVIQTDAATYRTLRDAFYAAHAPGPPQPLWIDDDRYVNAEVKSLSMVDWEQGMTHVDYEVGFYVADPFAYQGAAHAATSNTTNLATGGASSPPSNTSQIANPITAPTVVGAAAATALLAGTYKVAYTWRDLFGETQVSAFGSATITAGQKINVTAIALPPGATSANLYLSIAAGSLTIAWVQTWDGTSVSITTLPASPNSTNVAVGGTAYALPIFSIPVTAAPTGGLVYCSATGGGVVWLFTLAPTVTGTYIVDCTRQRQRVTLAGVDVTGIFVGTFSRFAGNATNPVVLGVSGGAAIVGAAVSWQNRWFNL